jgi:chorismate-pyruvate lyase
MNLKLAATAASVHWVPAERLGQLQVDPHLRPWLIAQGRLSVRLRSVCGDRYALRLAGLWSGLLNGSLKRKLGTDDDAGLFQDVEMCCADKVWVFAQTVIPDSTLCLNPWLAEMGDAPLDETLAVLSGVERSAYEYAWLPDGDPLTDRALRDARIKPGGLWARRSRVTLRRAPLLMQETFLPATGQS